MSDRDTVTTSEPVRRGLLGAPAAPVAPTAAVRVRPEATARTGRSARQRPGKTEQHALFSRRWLRVVAGALLPIILLTAWQLSTSLGLVTTSQLPSPEMVWAAGLDLAQRGLLGQYAAISTQRVLVGFAIGALLGLAFGASVGLSRVSDMLFAPTLGAIRAVPSLAWIPLLLLWLGIQEDSKITLIAIGAFFPVYTTVASALRHVDRQLVEAGQAFGLTGLKLFLVVQLPAVIPSVVSGLRLALAQAWLFLVAAELIASSMGLGFLLIDSQSNGRVDRILLAIIMLAVIGKLTDALVGLFETWANKKWA